MRPNVFITARERGKVIARREGHNVWTDPGRDYLRRVTSLSAQDPDVPVVDTRPKYLQFGVGGKTQSLSIDAAIDAAYPTGEDPYGTNGRQYDHAYPTSPAISTLERPIRRTGGTTPYPGAPSDEWLT